MARAVRAVSVKDSGGWCHPPPIFPAMLRDGIASIEVPKQPFVPHPPPRTKLGAT
jgi:hypothetical protein